MAVRRMAAKQVISKEVLNRLEQQIDRAWQRDQTPTAPRTGTGAPAGLIVSDASCCSHS